MRCPRCGRHVPEEVRYCPECGSPVGSTVTAAPVKMEQTIPSWKVIVAVVAVVAIVLTPVLIYSMPWSKVKVILTHSEYSGIGVEIYIDGILKGAVSINPGTTIVGVWSVDAGTHTVQIDRGDWYFVDNWFFEDYWAYEDPDGYADFTYAYEVGPLYTKNVYITL